MSYPPPTPRPDSAPRAVVFVVCAVVLLIVVSAGVYGVNEVRRMLGPQAEDPTLDRYPEVRLVKGVVSGAGAAGEAFRANKGRYPTTLAELAAAGYSHDPSVGVYVGKSRAPDTFCVQGYYGQLGGEDSWTFHYTSGVARSASITLGTCPS